MASPVSPGAPPPPPPRRAASVSVVAPREVERDVDESPDSDAAPTVVRSEPPPRGLMPSEHPAEQREASGSVPPPTLARAVSLPPAADSGPEPVTTVPRPPSAGPSFLDAGTEWLSRARTKLSGMAHDGIEFLDVHDAWVPVQWRGRVRGSALVGSGALLVALGVVGTVSLLKRSTVAAPQDSREVKVSPVARAQAVSKPAAVVAPAPAPSPVAPVRDVAAALPAPRNVEASAGEEGTLLLDSATALSREGRDAEAVMLVERAVLRNPELRTDPRVHDVLLRTAHSEDKASVAASFGLLESSMGERGAELMYEISLTRVGKDSSRRRAQAWLRGKQFAKNAALPLFITVKLREAKTCEDKHALLPLAAGGGKQTLDYLRELQSHTTCAPDDLVNCYPCMRADNRLSDAISAIEKRTRS